MKLRCERQIGSGPRPMHVPTRALIMLYSSSFIYTRRNPLHYYLFSRALCCFPSRNRFCPFFFRWEQNAEWNCNNEFSHYRLRESLQKPPLLHIVRIKPRRVQLRDNPYSCVLRSVCAAFRIIERQLPRKTCTCPLFCKNWTPPAFSVTVLLRKCFIMWKDKNQLILCIRSHNQISSSI
jgi:hypothetical protein